MLFRPRRRVRPRGLRQRLARIRPGDARLDEQGAEMGAAGGSEGLHELGDAGAAGADADARLPGTTSSTWPSVRRRAMLCWTAVTGALDAAAWWFSASGTAWARRLAPRGMAVWALARAPSRGAGVRRSPGRPVAADGPGRPTAVRVPSTLRPTGRDAAGPVRSDRGLRCDRSAVSALREGLSRTGGALDRTARYARDRTGRYARVEDAPI